ncbi:hypothetical protein BDZ89DRAFT_970030, partial [Hymenopellis radicata]
QRDHWKLNFGSTDFCSNSFHSTDICYIGRDGSRHGDESWGNPDNMADEG